jgi:alpha-ribazole phosphatase
VGSVWLVRHAPTTLRGVCYGQSDVPVEPEPSEAARLIASQWERAGLERAPEVWSSPWARTQTVAAELAALWRVSLKVDPRLSELSFGVWEGRCYDEIERTDRTRWQHWMQNYEVEAPPQGETVADLRARVCLWLDERRASNTTVLAVTHAGFMRTSRAVLAGMPYASVVGEAVPHLRIEQVL